jgi:Tfp pilus assembly protein PilN
VVLLVIGAAGAAFWWSDREVTHARDSLAAVQAETTRLETQRRSYAEVPKTQAELEAAEGARADVMANDVLWHRYLTDLKAATPDGVTFSSLTFKVGGPNIATQGAPAATPGTEVSADPFAPANPVGTVTISGISGTYRQVATWMDALDKVSGLDVSTLTSATGVESDVEQAVKFSSGISITSDALSHRFDRKAS